MKMLIFAHELIPKIQGWGDEMAPDQNKQLTSRAEYRDAMRNTIKLVNREKGTQNTNPQEGEYRFSGVFITQFSYRTSKMRF